MVSSVGPSLAVSTTGRGAKLSVAGGSISPTLLRLPFDLPLADWPSPPILPAPAAGVSRHVVRFVSADAALLAVKELPEPFVRQEYAMLSYLARQSVPVVEAVGTVVDRNSGDGQGLLLTRYLDFSLPYRDLFGSDLPPAMLEPLLDAMAELLVRLHLVGFFWGDCSISNTLFRRDAGALAAYLVDAETGELHEGLTDGQRNYDLELAMERIAAELLDVIAQAAEEGNVTVAEKLDPLWVAQEVHRRYNGLWCEVTKEEIINSEDDYKVNLRVHRLNELGFDVDQVEVVPDAAGSHRLRVRTRVVEPGHHRRALAILTGLQVQENQARRLLSDLSQYRSALHASMGREVSDELAAVQWLEQIYRPTLDAVPHSLQQKLEPAELFHQVLDHRWFLSEQRRSDVGMQEAVKSFICSILPNLPDERRLIDPEDTPQ